MCKTHTDLERERFRKRKTNRGLKVTLEVTPSYSAQSRRAQQTPSMPTYLQTDPTRRICISHYEYSELTVHKGIMQLYRFIIEFASTH